MVCSAQRNPSLHKRNTANILPTAWLRSSSTPPRARATATPSSQSSPFHLAHCKLMLTILGTTGRRTSSSVLPSLTGKGCAGISVSSSVYVCWVGRGVCTEIQSICMHLRGCTLNKTVTKRAGSKNLTQVDGFLRSSWDAMAWRPWAVVAKFQIEKLFTLQTRTKRSIVESLRRNIEVSAVFIPIEIPML